MWSLSQWRWLLIAELIFYFIPQFLILDCRSVTLVTNLYYSLVTGKGNMFDCAHILFFTETRCVCIRTCDMPFGWVCKWSKKHQMRRGNWLSIWTNMCNKFVQFCTHSRICVRESYHLIRWFWTIRKSDILAKWRVGILPPIFFTGDLV